MITRLVLLGLGLLAGLQLATQVFAWTYGYDPVLGAGLPLAEAGRVYPPWRIFAWRHQFGEVQPEAFSSSAFLILLGVLAGLGAGAMTRGHGRHRRIRGWGGMADARAAGLRADAGCVLGVLNSRLLATLDMRPTLVTGGTRSGKGRGHVAPTLLLWGESVLVHDPKKELWRITAGWRADFSHALYFDPRDPASARWNPLAEIRPGPNELAQVQRLVAILADPGGARDDEAIWDKAASEIL